MMRKLETKADFLGRETPIQRQGPCLAAYSEIYKILSGQGIPMDDHYDDIEDAAEALKVIKDKAIVFLRDWQQEEMG